VSQIPGPSDFCLKDIHPMIVWPSPYPVLLQPPTHR
jgi:hypothetical protein